MNNYNYDINNFILKPSPDDHFIKIFDKYGKNTFTINFLSYFFYKNNLVVIKMDNQEDLFLSFKDNITAVNALELLNSAKKIITENNEDYNTYATLIQLNEGLSVNLSASTELFAPIIHYHSLTASTDVHLSAITNGQVLVYNNGIFVNSAFTFDTSAFENNYYNISALTNSGESLINWLNIFNLPSTLSGYGINDSYSKNDVYTKNEILSSGGTSILDQIYFDKNWIQTHYTDNTTLNIILSGYTLTSHTHTISNLSDIGSFNVGDYLIYSANTWHGVPAPNMNNYYNQSQINNILNNYILSSITYSLTALTDVMFSNLQSGDFFIYNGVKWSNSGYSFNNYFTKIQLLNGSLDGRYFTNTAITNEYYDKSGVSYLIQNLNDSIQQNYFNTGQTNNLYSITSHTHDSRYYTQTWLNTHIYTIDEITSMYFNSAQTLSLFIPYYTSAQTNLILNNYSSTSHTHLFSLSGLTDTLISSPQSGQLLQYSAGTWKNYTLSLPDISVFYTKNQLDNGELDNRYISLSGSSNIVGSLIPGLSGLSLGSVTNPWKDLHVSQNTIFIGGIPISTEGGKLQISGQTVALTAETFNSAQTYEILQDYYTKEELLPTSGSSVLDSRYYTTNWILTHYIDSQTIYNNFFTSAQTLSLLTNYYTSAQTLVILENYSLSSHTHTWNNITGKPNTLAGYNIIDIYNTAQTYSQSQIENLLSNIDLSYLSAYTLLTIFNNHTGATNPHGTTFNSLSSTAHTHLWLDIINSSHTHDERYYTQLQLLPVSGVSILDSRYYTQNWVDSHFLTTSEIAVIYFNSAQTLSLFIPYYTSAQTNSILNRYLTTATTYSLTALTDVVFSNLQPGDFFIYNGIKWTNSGYSFSNYFSKNDLLNGGVLDVRYLNISSLTNSYFDKTGTTNLLNLLNQQIQNSYYNSAQTNTYYSLTSHTHDTRYFTQNQLLGSGSSQGYGSLDQRYYTQNWIDTHFVDSTGITVIVQNITTVITANTSDIYDYINNNFYNSAQTNTYYSLTSHTHYISNLTDVNILNKQTGQTLIYSAGTWVNKFINVENLNNVLSGATDGQILIYSGGTWKPMIIPPTSILTIENNGSNVLSGVTAINFIGAITGLEVEAIKNGNNTVNVYIPAPNYVSHFNTNDGIVDATVDDVIISLRRIALPTSEGTPYYIGDWSGDTILTTHPTINGGLISSIIYSANTFSLLNLATTFTIRILSADNNTVLAYNTITIDSAKTYTQSGITITISNLSTDANKYKCIINNSINLATILPNGGRFSVSLTHYNGTDGTFTKSQNNLFYDNYVNNPTIGTVTLAETIGQIVTRKLSGVEYYNTGSSFTVTISNIDNLNDRSFPSIQLGLIDNNSLGLSDIDLSGQSLTNWTKYYNNTNASYTNSGWTITNNDFCIKTSNAKVSAKWIDWSVGSLINSNSLVVLINTQTTLSDRLNETFNDESWRCPQLANFDTYSAKTWNSSLSGSSSDAVFGYGTSCNQAGRITTNFKTYNPNPTTQPNYSSLDSTVYLIREFRHDGTASSQFTINIQGDYDTLEYKLAKAWDGTVNGGTEWIKGYYPTDIGADINGFVPFSYGNWNNGNPLNNTGGYSSGSKISGTVYNFGSNNIINTYNTLYVRIGFTVSQVISQLNVVFS